MKKIRILFQNISLYKKILTIFGIFLFCTYLVFFISFHILTEQYEKELYQVNSQVLNRVSAAINTHMDSIEAITYEILQDDTIQENLVKLKDYSSNSRRAVWRREIYQSLYDYNFPNHCIEAIHIVPLDGMDICMGNSSHLEAFDTKVLSDSVFRAYGQAVWAPSDRAGNMVVCARQIRQIYRLDLGKLADLYIVIDMERLIHDTLKDFGYQEKGNQFFLFFNGHQICPGDVSPEKPLLNLLDELKNSASPYLIADLNGNKNFIINGTIPGADWDYLYVKDYRSLFGRVQFLRTQVTFLVLGFSIFTTALVALTFRKILIHLDILIQKIQLFGEGHSLSPKGFSYDYSSRNDEIGKLHRNFDQMTHSVKVLRDENYDKQLLLRDAQIKMLKQQMNPHFLYNTLDTINYIAQSHGMDDISHMVRCLANVFRANISYEEDLILLSEDLKILDSYIQIQKIRFKERLDFQLNVSEDCLSVRIPSFCIQPLVENALKHAMEESFEPCLIRLTISSDEKICSIQVANTNSQFDENLLWKLEHHQVVSKRSGVGLSNIYDRLKLLYGTNCRIRFANQNNMASVTLQIPRVHIIQEEEVPC